MKPLNTLALVAFAVMMSAGLIGCGKTSNSSPASTPATCVMGANGQLVYPGTYTPCSSGSMLCPTYGYYQTPYGQNSSCTPGQYVNNGVYTYQQPVNYPYPSYPTNQTATGCGQYYYVYGTPYVPLYINGQLSCVRYDLMQTAASSNYSAGYYNPGYASYGYSPGYYNYGYNYYYAYPPYTGAGCPTQLSLGAAGGGVAGSLSVCL